MATAEQAQSFLELVNIHRKDAEMAAEVKAKAELAFSQAFVRSMAKTEELRKHEARILTSDVRLLAEKAQIHAMSSGRVLDWMIATGSGK